MFQDDANMSVSGTEFQIVGPVTEKSLLPMLGGRGAETDVVLNSFCSTVSGLFMWGRHWAIAPFGALRKICLPLLFKQCEI